MKRQHLSFFLALLGLMLISSCNVRQSKKRQAIIDAGTLDPIPFRGPWTLTVASDYTYDSNFISISSGKATLLEVDQTFENSTDFASGAHTGTTYTGGGLTLSNSGTCNGLSTNCSELDSSWTPKWDDIIGYWKLDESPASNGTVVAAKVGSDGVLRTNNGATNKTVTGKLNKGLRFDSDQDYVEIPYYADLNFSTSDFSTSAWVYADTQPVAGFSRYFGSWTGGGATQGWSVGLDTVGQGACNVGNRVFVQFYKDGANRRLYQAEQELELQRWYHVVTVRTGDSVNVYINGKEVTTQVCVTNGSADAVTTTGPLYIGRSENLVSGAIDGRVDDVALWDVALTEADAIFIYKHQSPKYSGSYVSKVIDAGASTIWTNLDWNSPLPFGKEMTGTSGSELQVDYPSMVTELGTAGDGDLSKDLVGLWHFNETSWSDVAGEVKDRSGNGNHGTGKTGATTSVQSIFGRAGTFDGVDDYVELPVMTYGAQFSISMWAKVDNVSGAKILLAKKTGLVAESVQLFLINDTLYGRAFSADDIFIGRGATGAISANKWHHISMVYYGGPSSNTIILYVDGKIVDDVDDNAGIFTTFNDLAITSEIGSQSSGTLTFFPGEIDEVGIWSRPLHPNEVLGLYRRGSNKVKYQIRTCNDSACDTERWRGPDGTGQTYYSELHNCAPTDISDEGCLDQRGTSSPNIVFADFSSSVLNNRYFQYRVVLESDDANSLCSGSPCAPSISSIEVGPSGRYYRGSPTVVNNVPAVVSTLSQFLETSIGSCSITYQLSNDNTNFYYWNGVTWFIGAGVGQSNSAAIIKANISSFPVIVGAGEFYWKSFLTSDGTQNCELSFS
jgi:hypothetical protein